MEYRHRPQRRSHRAHSENERRQPDTGGFWLKPPTPKSHQEQEDWDPSALEVLYRIPSTDEEMGTDERAIHDQAAACRVALEKHFNDFEKAVGIAAQIALGGNLGLGKMVRTDRDLLNKWGKLAFAGVKLMWDWFGSSTQIADVMQITKEILLGSAESYAEKAEEFVKDQLEKHATEVSLKKVTNSIVAAVNINTAAFVSHAKDKISDLEPAALAATWRLLSGTVDNITVDGAKLKERQKETVRTEMLEMLTGIQVGGAFTVRLANTLRQQALVDFAMLVNNPDDQAAALNRALSGSVPEETKRVAKKLGLEKQIEDDEADRERVRE